MATILIIYGSTSGNTELVCDQIAEVLSEHDHAVNTRRVEACGILDMVNADLVILACPTYGHGVLQPDFVPFAKELKEFDLTGGLFAVVGLGDPKYEREYHLESANILEKIVRDSGGELLTSSLRISRSPVIYLDWHVKKWTENLSEQLKSLF